MIDQLSKISAALSYTPFDVVRKAYIIRARVESGRIADARQWMLENGFELLDVPADQLLTKDGREVLHAYGKAWALRLEVHTKRLAEALEQARQRDAAMADQQSQPTQQVATTTACSTLVDGQLCGGNLVLTTVCPKCALGKSGVAATLTCDVCGHVTAVMRGGK